MRITTKTGDAGETGRLFGSRVSKTSEAVAAVGDIDELNAALGLIKAELTIDDRYHSYIEKIQHNLTLFMGEVISEPAKRLQYIEKFSYVCDEDLAYIDQEVERLQDMEELEQASWVLYGNSKIGAKADYASKVCRRAERSFLHLVKKEEVSPDKQCRDVLLKYINRLSDLLHLMARYFDHLNLK